MLTPHIVLGPAAAGKHMTLVPAPGFVVGASAPYDSFNGDAAVTAEDRAGNQGSITFTVTRDVDAPVVTVSASGAPTVSVEWAGDDGTGAGVENYDVQVRVDDGPWTGWLTATTQTQADYVGEYGHRYAFRARAKDNVSNTSDWSAEASLRIVHATKYYYFGARRVAMRNPDGVYYLHADHLGSTSLTTGDEGGVVARQLYHPYGSVRWSAGTLPTDFEFTGQRDDGTGLIFMYARYYHPYLCGLVASMI